MDLEYTVDELVGLLKRSSDLNIVVEGKDDLFIYRWVLDELGVLANLCATGGCGTLRKVYLRRNEFPNAKVIFVTDKDTYVYGKVPEEYSGIIFTEGYSIENDLYYGRKLYNSFMDKKDRQLFDKALEQFLLYYVSEIDKMIAGNNDYNLKEKPKKILDDKTFQLNKGVFPQPPSPSENQMTIIKKNYDLLLRGHSLFGIIEMVLNRKDRAVRHNEGGIYEICYKNYKSVYIEDLQTKIKSQIENYSIS